MKSEQNRSRSFPSSSAMFTGVKCLAAASWNISAVNSNPFEYWITHPDPAYNDLMRGVQNFIDSPEADLPVHQIFSDAMFSQLIEELQSRNITGLKELEEHWTSQYRKRMAIGKFLKDKEIGVKRLVSMPDRITNTIHLANGGVCLRPSVINAYTECELTSIETWWVQWRNFMFHTSVEVVSGGTKPPTPQTVCSLIGPILHSKYPAITPEEQAISVPLQILCLGILDAIFVYIVNSVAANTWERVRRSLCNALINHKEENICRIMASYRDVHVFFIQEAAAAFTKNVSANAQLKAKYALIAPVNLDGKRDQNSFLLIDRNYFKETSVTDVTADVLELMAGDFVAPGDLLVASVEDSDGTRWLLASFHGDSNGLSTQPLLCAINELANAGYPDHIFLIGLDANTHSTVKCAPGAANLQQGVLDLMRFLRENGIVSCWDGFAHQRIATTCNARTFLQTQTNKATRFDRRAEQQDLKDWILAFSAQVVRVSDVVRDNTGQRKYLEDSVFPTLDFPSDHALISAVIQAIDPSQSFKITTSTPPKCEGSSASLDVGTSSNATEQTVDTAAIDGARGDAARGRVASLFSRRKKGGKGNKPKQSLYDYWGIGEAPLAQQKWAESRYSASGLDIPCAVDDPGVDPAHGELAEEEVAAREVRRLCERHFVQMTVNPRGDELDRKRLILSHSDDRTIWMVFSSRPLSMGVSKWWFRIIVFILGISVELAGILGLLPPLRFRPASGKHFRFTPVELRGGVDRQITGPSMDGLGLLLRRCKVQVPFNTSKEGASLTLSFVEEVEMDGYWFRTAQQPMEDDPIKMRMERSMDKFQWVSIPYPAWTQKQWLEDAPSGRGEEMKVDFGPRFKYIASSCSVLLSGFFFLATAIIAQWVKAQTAVRIGAIGYLVQACNQLAMSIDQMFSLTTSSAQLSLACSLIMSISSFGMFFGTLHETYAVSLLAICDPIYATFYSLQLYQARVDFSWGVNQVLTVLALVGSAIVFLTLYVARKLILRWVFNTLVKEDTLAYDELWKGMLSTSHHAEALGRLKRLVRQLKNTTQSDKQLMQRHHALGAGSILSSHRPSKTASFRHILAGRVGPPIVSLDQLYAQARIMDVFLKQKCKSWAHCSQGCFWVRPSSGEMELNLVRWQDLCKHPSLGSVVWAGVKPEARALAKLVRCYECKAWRLADCCRQAIYFEELEHLSACLESIWQDPDIEIIHIKNMLDDDYDSRWTAGFRIVRLSVRIKTQDTHRLGIDIHICELQLCLKAFAVLQNQERLARYIILRNCRGARSLGRASLDFVMDLWDYFSASFNKMPWIRRKAGVAPDHADQRSGFNTSLWMQQPNVLDALPSSCHQSSQDLEAAITAVDDKSLITNMGQRINPSNDVDIFQLQRDRMIEGQIRSSMSRHLPFGFLKDKLMFEAVTQAHSGSVWDISHPFAAALCKSWLIWLILVVWILSIIILAMMLVSVARNNTIDAFHFRFVALELRGSTSFSEGWTMGLGDLSLGVTTNGCELPLAEHNATVSVTDWTVQLSFPQKVGINGWWFSVGTHVAPDYHPTRFRLEASFNKEGRYWQKIGSSTPVWSWTGEDILQEGYYNTTSEAGHRVEYDLRVPWQILMVQLSTTISSFLMCLGLGIVVMTKNHLEGKWIVCGSLMFCAMSFSIASVSYLVSRRPVFAVLPGFSCIMNLIEISVFLWQEHSIPQYLAILGPLNVGFPFIYYFLLLKASEGLVGSGLALLLNLRVSIGICEILVALFAFWARWLSSIRANKVVKSDWTMYDKCWAGIMQTDGLEQSLERIRELVAQISCSLPLDSRQRGRAIESCPDECNGVTQQAAVAPLIVDLDQLFVQAVGLELFLQYKVQEWALASGGYLCIQQETKEHVCRGDLHFERCDHIAHSEVLRSRVHWPGVKSRKRAVEKLYRSYNLEVARLLDCCRASIYFEGPCGALTCLECISRDKSAKLVLIKNRLDPAYDASEKAGFRSICINLRIETAETIRLGLETHICELQLALIPFAKLASEEGHARYKIWRNFRGR